MKKLSLLSILLISGLILFSSCGDDDDDDMIAIRANSGTDQSVDLDKTVNLDGSTDPN